MKYWVGGRTPFSRNSCSLFGCFNNLCSTMKTTNTNDYPLISFIVFSRSLLYSFTNRVVLTLPVFLLVMRTIQIPCVKPAV